MLRLQFNQKYMSYICQSGECLQLAPHAHGFYCLFVGHAYVTQFFMRIEIHGGPDR